MKNFLLLRDVNHDNKFQKFYNLLKI